MKHPNPWLHMSYTYIYIHRCRYMYSPKQCDAQYPNHKYTIHICSHICRCTYPYQNSETPHFLITHVLYMCIHINVGIYTGIKKKETPHSLNSHIPYVHTCINVSIYIHTSLMRLPVPRSQIYYRHTYIYIHTYTIHVYT